MYAPLFTARNKSSYVRFGVKSTKVALTTHLEVGPLLNLVAMFLSGIAQHSLAVFWRPPKSVMDSLFVGGRGGPKRLPNVNAMAVRFMYPIPVTFKHVPH